MCTVTKVETPQLEIGRPATGFDLPATDGRAYKFKDIAGPKGTVIAFICNHCPYVVAMIDRLAEAARTLQADGIGVAAICSNDAISYPADAFPRMIEFAQAHELPFPYLHDGDQSVARAFGAVCTPDIFGFDGAGMLRYRGRLDAGRAGAVPDGARRELVEAMRLIARTGQGPVEQIPSMGCSIKWKNQ